MLRPGAWAAKLERVAIRAVVVQAVVEARKPAQRQVGFRGVEISRRGVHAQAIAIARTRNFLPRADGHGMPKQATEPDGVQPNWVAVFRIVSTGNPRSFRECRHCGKCSGVWEARSRRKHDRGSAFIGAEGIGLIISVEIMRIRPNGVIGVLRRLVVSEETFRFFVEAATWGIVPYAGEKARHSAVC